mgnify:CR=1 FL=1
MARLEVLSGALSLVPLGGAVARLEYYASGGRLPWIGVSHPWKMGTLGSQGSWCDGDGVP